jgi:hypothetical protein
MVRGETVGLAARSGPAPFAAGRLSAWALGAGILAGVAAWLIGEATLQTFRPKMVTADTPVGRLTAAPADEVVRTDIKNAALAFAVQGACLGLALGLAGGLAAGSARAGVVAGLAGAVLGAALAYGASAALQPLYYRNVQLDQHDQGLAVSMLVHGGIWAAAGLAGGVAFGLGLRRERSSIARAAVGGVVGALLAGFLFEVTAAMAFPAASTTRPLSLSGESRLMAKLMASLLSAAGIAALLIGRPASPSSRPEPIKSEPRAGPPSA